MGGREQEFHHSQADYSHFFLLDKGCGSESTLSSIGAMCSHQVARCGCWAGWLIPPFIRLPSSLSQLRVNNGDLYRRRNQPPCLQCPLVSPLQLQP